MGAVTACDYGEPEQVPLAQYPCPGRCGCWVRTPQAACFPCWFATHTYEPRAVRMLSPEDPRKAKVAPDPRDARRRPPSFGRRR